MKTDLTYLTEFDPGPPLRFAEIFSRVPDYGPYKNKFWYDWGPVFYRGRLDGSARLFCVASDPGPTERVACRTLVGDAGQRVQGFLSKLGLTRSYICVNAFTYALYPSQALDGKKVLADPTQKAWRNELYTAIEKASQIQAVVAFGMEAQEAVRLWETKGSAPIFNVPHPSSRDPKALVNQWKTAITKLRSIVTPDADGSNTGPNYSTTFSPDDYTGIPSRDLPFGLPPWFGDDKWGRSARPRHNNSVKRPTPDDRHTLIWIAPKRR